jgi:outer membrane protein assembly factor BamB
MKKLYVLVIALFAIASTHAQESNTSDWSCQFDQSVKWQRVTSFGTLIVCTNNALYGINTDTGEKTWEQSTLGGLLEESYMPIEGSPFVQVAKGGENPAIFILEPFQGSIVFDSKRAGIDEVMQTYILPKNLSVLIQGKAAGSTETSLTMIDLASGDKLWQKEGEFALLTSFLEMGGDEFLLSNLWNVYRINSKSGDVIWEKPLDPTQAKQLAALGALGDALKGMAENTLSPGDVIAQFYPMDGGQFILGFQAKQEKTETSQDGKTTTTISYMSGYQCLDFDTGDPVWAESVTFPGKMGTLIFDDAGLIVCPNSGDNTKINLVSYSSGSKSWGKKGKGLKVKGGVIDYYYTPDGILLIIEDKGSSSSNPSYKLNLLDVGTGMLKFEKYAKVKGEIVSTQMIEAGLFVATSREVDVFDTTTGERLFAKTIKTDGKLHVGNDSNIYVFDTKNKALVSVDKSSGSASTMSKADIKFQGKEDPTELEIRDGGVAIVGMQNIAVIDNNGGLDFNHYYEAPKLPGILRALNAAMAIRAAYIGAVSKMAAGAYGAVAHDPDNPLGPEISLGISDAYNQLGDAGFEYANMYMDAVKQRFQATADSRDFIFMMTVGDDRKDNRLIRVNKDSGVVMDYVSLGKDKDPVYEVDNISNSIFYRNESNTISCYKF